MAEMFHQKYVEIRCQRLSTKLPHHSNIIPIRKALTKQRNGTKGNSSRGGSGIVKTHENTTIDGARIAAAFSRGG
jgi:hypothetical protein